MVSPISFFFDEHLMGICYHDDDWSYSGTHSTRMRKVAKGNLKSGLN